MDEPTNAYRIKIREPDAGMPNGELVMDYVALAATPEAALQAVRTSRGRPGTERIVAEGEEVMMTARRKGLRDGEVSEL